MKGKGKTQPEIVSAAFLILYMVLGSPFLYQVLIVTHLFTPPLVPLKGKRKGGGLHDLFARNGVSPPQSCHLCNGLPPANCGGINCWISDLGRASLSFHQLSFAEADIAFEHSHSTKAAFGILVWMSTAQLRDRPKPFQHFHLEK